MCIQKQKWKWALWQLHAFQLWVPLQIILSKEQSATPLHCKSTRSSSDRNTKVTDYFCHCSLYSLTENKAQNYLSDLYCPVGKYENNMLGTLIVYLLANYLQVYKKKHKNVVLQCSGNEKLPQWDLYNSAASLEKLHFRPINTITKSYRPFRQKNDPNSCQKKNSSYAS